MNVVLDEGAKDQLNKLQEKVGAGSMSETIRKALSFYESIFDLTRDGSTIILRDEHGKERHIIPLF